MAKKNLRKEINEISRISKNIPSLMETIHFSPEREREMYNEDDDFEMEEPEMEDTPMAKPQEDVVPSSNEGNSNVEGFIANMRKESLGIMKALADNPDDAVYQFAKKIFQLADKAHEDQKEGKDINGEPKEGMQKPMMK
jgi:hypothetical protein